MNKERLQKVLIRLDQIHVDKMLITDPLSIFYLTGRMISSGERFQGLLIGRECAPVIFVNELLGIQDDLGITKVVYKDTDPLIPVLKEHIVTEGTLGVDKIMPARFLLPIISSGLASRVVNGSLAVDKARAVKGPDEIEKMRQASRINDQAMAAFKKLVREGITEAEIAAQTLAIYQSLGASGYSFPPIVSFGINATNPHHMPDGTKLREGDVVLFDIGCVYDHYCSDMTRTFFYKKEPTAAQKKVYELVRRANEEAEAMLKPGIEIATIDRKARDIITDGGYGPYFTHRLGHFIGLEDHEFGDVSLANESLTEPGNIFSIEPGIYDQKTAGVRIEDLVLITENGYECLNALPKEIEILV